MISAQTAISKARRDLTVASVLKFVLAIGAAVALLMGASSAMIFAAVLGLWLVFSFRSAQGTRIALDSTGLIASGQYEEAERRIEQSLRTFTLFRNAKL